ncbi:hypothetical protein [Arsukibacterium sp.]|uniref:hypothetical protein n=1 Tax=Arsukibacterium sp. TaxID=1977258 RepID=UPI00299DEF64|nr:hypothetical protein [Arsukibacterium sp.]MDX1677733.1 hypothetical protein [Arsukibacterium sp.]
MLIEFILKQDKLRLQQCAAQFQQQQQLRYAYLWLTGQRCKQFISSAPGLTLSFSAGMLMTWRHTSTVKTLRKVGAVRWLRYLI